MKICIKNFNFKYINEDCWLHKMNNLIQNRGEIDIKFPISLEADTIEWTNLFKLCDQDLLILENYFKISSIEYYFRAKKDINHALFLAAISDNLPAMKLFIDNNADLFMKNGIIFKKVAEIGYKNILEFLFSQTGIDDKTLHYCLYAMIKKNHLGVLKLLFINSKYSNSFKNICKKMDLSNLIEGCNDEMSAFLLSKHSL